MDDREAVYRRAAVERLLSPDELTEMLDVNRSQSWLILGITGLLMAAAVAWGVFGAVPITVRGEGLLQPPGGVLDITAPRPGRVSGILVVSGGVVAAGAPLMELTGGMAAGEGRVTTPYRARVLEVLANRGQELAVGTPLLTLEPADELLQAVLFVPEGAALRLRPGQTVRLAPRSVPHQAYGFLLGRVSRVSPFPATERGLRRVLSQETLVQAFLARHLRVQVDVELRRDPDHPDRWQWSSGRGPEAPLPSRTEVTGEIVLRQERPIFQVLPWLRSLGGAA